MRSVWSLNDSDKFEFAGNLGADSSQDSYIDGISYLTCEAGDEISNLLL